MNVVREISKINDRELELGTSSASWHDEYKDSAYVYVGGLNFDLTEGDVITIFSQYGEVMDVNLPRDKETGKTKGFGFLMYEDQRSTVLAVDNMNGAKVLDRTLRVDHVRHYKQPRVKGEDGEWVDQDEQSLNAKPKMITSKLFFCFISEVSSGPEIDPEDPMAAYLLERRREEKATKKAKKAISKGKHKNETPEERRARKERRKREKAALKASNSKKSTGLKGVEELLQTWKPDHSGHIKGRRSRSSSPHHKDSRTARTSYHREDAQRVKAVSRSRSRSLTPTDLGSHDRKRESSQEQSQKRYDDERYNRYRQTDRDQGRMNEDRFPRRDSVSQTARRRFD
ncbi:hypothetical protein DFH11DRAFT_1849744 [Phellopilus nigrolimitatus]|nr:hypothetical protein DFH11DRAFT_1849744 [Phellopilus nigrolimitatus]